MIAIRVIRMSGGLQGVHTIRGSRCANPIRCDDQRLARPADVRAVDDVCTSVIIGIVGADINLPFVVRV